MKNHYSGKKQKRFLVIIMDYHDSSKVFKTVPFGNPEKAKSFRQKLLNEGVKTKLKTKRVDLGKEFKEYGAVGKWVSKK